MIEMTAIFVWLMTIEFVGLLALPIASSFCGLLPDRGYAVSKPLGLLLLTYFTWLLVSLHLIRFGAASVALAFIILLLISAQVLLRKKPLACLAGNRAHMLKVEFIFLAAFSAMAFILSYKPDILAMASEDFMDYAFLQSILRSAYFPPPDSWLAGEVLSYYYFGQLEVAILTIFTKIPSGITYNLAVSTFFALTASTAYSLGYSLTRKSIYGILASLFVSVAGMLSGFLQMLVYLVPSIRAYISYAPLTSPDLLQWLRDFDFWTSITSVIPQAFVFYPYHAFVHGNLHAQMIGFAFQLMFLMLCLGVLKSKERISGTLCIIVALSLGFFAGLNIWEYPTYLAVLCLVLFIRAYGKHDIEGSLKNVVKSGGAIALISFILYIPYYAERDSGGFRGVLPVTMRTPLFDFLEVFGLFLFILASFLLAYYAVNRKRVPIVSYIAGAVIFIPTLIIGKVWDFQLLPLLTAFVLITAYGVMKFRDNDEESFSFLLIIAGGLVALFPEVFYIVDAMPWQRFNTLMKLYLQVWFLWGIASAYAIYYIHMRMKDKSKAVRSAYAAWAMLLIVVIFASLIHPIASTVSWTVGAGASIFGNTENGTLDGTKYMQKMHHGDYMAIQWIDENIPDDPTMLEAPGGAYEYSSQIATMTGIPTVLGWKSHEMMWNNDWSKIDEREKDVNRIYSTADVNEALMLLKKYDVQYIYIGERELEKYNKGPEKFKDERYFELVYKMHVEIYRVK